MPYNPCGPATPIEYFKRWLINIEMLFQQINDLAGSLFSVFEIIFVIQRVGLINKIGWRKNKRRLRPGKTLICFPFRKIEEMNCLSCMAFIFPRGILLQY